MKSIERITIDRKYYPDCVLSRLTLNFDSWQCWTLELPYKDNEPYVSSIPEGVYKAFKRFSPNKKYEVIELKGVPNRTHIQIHIGNFTSQILGCILPGIFIKHIDSDGVPDIGGSEMAFEQLMELLPDEFEVEIKS